MTVFSTGLLLATVSGVKEVTRGGPAGVADIVDSARLAKREQRWRKQGLRFLCPSDHEDVD